VVAEALTRLRGALERMCRRRFPSLDAGDVYQRASLRALERCESVRDRDRVDGWVRRIVVTSALDLLRERRGEITLSEEHDLEAPAPEEICACTLALMKSLPESYGDIIHRVDIDGADLPEVAERLKIATGNAAVRLHRARRALRSRLREHCGVETMGQCLTCVCNERGRCGTAP
jgi:RNA polymerase sigma-70 factor (ECF subfamily)